LIKLPEARVERGENPADSAADFCRLFMVKKNLAFLTASR
jgi:hypothetical protein